MFYKSTLLSFCFITIFAGKEHFQITCSAIKTSLGQLNSNHPIEIIGIGTQPRKRTTSPKAKLVELEITCAAKECKNHTKSPRTIWVTYLAFDAAHERNE